MVDHITYIKERLDPQKDWHSHKAMKNKSFYYLTEIITIVASALIPLINLVPWVSQEEAKPVLSAGLAAAVVVAASIAKLCKFQENWLSYRALAEALEREKELFRYAVGDYANGQETRGKILVERVENMLASTTSQFLSMHRTEKTQGTSQPSAEQNG